jgi:hypothetical protein
VFRIICPNGSFMEIAETLEGALDTIRKGRRGRYHIEDLRLNSLSNGQTWRTWGAIVKFPSGDISVQPLTGPE